MLHGVAMETAGNGGESARQRMCIKFCHFITYCRTPRACKLWRGTQKHSLLTWKNHFTRSYEEWMNFSSEAPRLWRFFSLFRGDKMLKGARADIARTRSQKQQISKFITVADIFLYRHHNADNVCKNSKTRHDGGFKMQPWLHLLSSDGQRWTIYYWFSSSADLHHFSAHFTIILILTLELLSLILKGVFFSGYSSILKCYGDHFSIEVHILY